MTEEKAAPSKTCNAKTPHQHRRKSSEKLLDKQIILQFLGIREGFTIIDAGCGNGYMAKEFSKILRGTGKIYAIDPDAEAMEILGKETSGTNIETMTADITTKTKIENSSIDLIYMSTVFHGFSAEQKKSFKNEINRLLKPEGRLAIVEIMKGNTPFGPPVEMRYSAEELKREIDLVPLVTVHAGEYFYMQIFEKIEEFESIEQGIL